MDRLPQAKVYDDGIGHSGWYSRQHRGWQKFRERIESIPNVPGDRMVRQKVLAERVLLALEIEGGALIKGVRQSQGGVGADPGDVWELSEYAQPEVQGTPLVREAVKTWMDVLRQYPTPGFVARTSCARWSQAKGLGFTKIAGPVSLPWLDAQTEAFSSLIKRLDVLSDDEKEGPVIRQAAVDAANDLTKPGGAILYGVDTHEGGDPRQAPIGGPGAASKDVADICWKHYLYDIDSMAPHCNSYTTSLDRPDVPFYIIASSPGPHAKRRWGWYEPQEQLYRRLIRDIGYSADIRQRRRLIPRLENPSGVLAQGAALLPAGGPGAHWRDVKAILRAEGDYDPNQHADIRWVATAETYLELLKRLWPSIDSDMRASGYGRHAGEPDY